MPYVSLHKRKPFHVLLQFSATSVNIERLPIAVVIFVMLTISCRYEKVPAKRPGKEEDMAGGILFAVTNQYLNRITIPASAPFIHLSVVRSQFGGARTDWSLHTDPFRGLQQFCPLARTFGMLLTILD